MKIITPFPDFYPQWLFHQYYRFEPKLKEWISEKSSFFKTYNFENYLEKALLPGRRTRPLILLEIQNRISERSKEGIIASISIELLHRAAIILDDFLDADSIRRGKQTFHTEFGLEASVLFPHLITSFAYEEYLKLNPSSDQLTNWLISIQEIVLAEYSDLVQQSQMTLEQQFDLSIKRTQLFFQLINNYLWILTGKNDKSLSVALGTFGKYFQISNDVFDTFYFSEDSRYNEKSEKRFTLSFPSIKLIRQNKINKNDVFKTMSFESFKYLQEMAWEYWGNEKSILEPEKDNALYEIYHLNMPTNIKELFIELINLCSKKDYWLHTY
ncbi:MAG: polyprenyl synthetase family protein [Saprospiraceae bacterium]|jgi:geranylgeranyl pyrophosphate synthase|nr:polyprenyl synthetase family protein [Saprospiraceae bacterium]MBP9209882.1 polyprenyl synthetase family protein [Saprospiraceae bacterium]MBV6472709.1 hypothetical protein [Saprospiraceae bacterium]